MKIDYVLTYVDNSDKEWQTQYKKVSRLNGRPVNTNGVRYRNWNTLKYLFRGIAECLPFINNLYVIVERESQIPKWANTKTVKFILHKDIIPQKYLPTYNSDVLEIFMHNISGLSEYFLYGNDDMFPVGVMSEDDWFSNGLPRMNIRDWKYSENDKMYRHILKSTENFARSILKLETRPKLVFHSEHNIGPMRKSTWEFLWDNGKEQLEKSCSPFRKPINISKEAVNFFEKLNGTTVKSDRVIKYFEFKSGTTFGVKKALRDKSTQCICINDTPSITNFNFLKRSIHELFEKRFPYKCKYEK